MDQEDRLAAFITLSFLFEVGAIITVATVLNSFAAGIITFTIFAGLDAFVAFKNL